MKNNRIDYFIKVCEKRSHKNIVINFKDSTKAESIIRNFSNLSHNLRIVDFGYKENGSNILDMHTIGMINFKSDTDITKAYRRLK